MHILLRTGFLLAAVLWLGVMNSHSGLTQTVYVDGSGAELGTIDVSTGAFTSIGTTTPTLFGMGFAPDGTLYGLDNQGSAHLYRIDPSTAATTDLGETNQSASAATTRKDGLIFAIDQNDPGLLYSVNPGTLAVNPIGNTGIAASGFLAFDNSGTLFTSDINTGTLYTVNPTTGAATAVGSLGFDVVTGVFLDNTLYGFTSDNLIVSIDRNTGAGSLLSSYSFPDGNIAIAAAVRPSVNPVPESGTLPLLTGIAAVSALWICHRRCSEAALCLVEHGQHQINV